MEWMSWGVNRWAEGRPRVLLLLCRDVVLWNFTCYSVYTPWALCEKQERLIILWIGGNRPIAESDSLVIRVARCIQGPLTPEHGAGYWHSTSPGWRPHAWTPSCLTVFNTDPSKELQNGVHAWALKLMLLRLGWMRAKQIRKKILVNLLTHSP